MADSIESFDEAKNMARVGTGFKGNPFFKSPAPVPAMEIGAGWPVEVDEKLKMTKTETPKPTDAWNQRR